MKNILVSACLLGEKCRYDGKSKTNEKILKLKEFYNVIPVCPEVLGGLSIPRNPCEILDEKLLDKNKNDFTEQYKKGAKKTLEIFKQNNAEFSVLKSKSPSCGKGLIYDGTFTGNLVSGNGVTTQLLLDNNLIVFNEDDIDFLLKNVKN